MIVDDGGLFLWGLLFGIPVGVIIERWIIEPVAHAMTNRYRG